MARRAPPPVSYGDDLEIQGAAGQTAEAPALPASERAAGRDRAPAAVEAATTVEENRGAGRRPILDKSAPTLMYLHPAGKDQLRRYAVAQGLKVKVHDLLLEALEEWGAKRGLAGPWRVEPSKPRRG